MRGIGYTLPLVLFEKDKKRLDQTGIKPTEIRMLGSIFNPLYRLALILVSDLHNAMQTTYPTDFMFLLFASMETCTCTAMRALPPLEPRLVKT